MKRSIGSLLLLGIVGTAMAQAPFTIVRPADGSKVREKVRVLFPLKSIPEDGYVGIYVGGKFVEATVPMKGANYLFYDIDTKARKIPDGPLTIEAVLYQDFNEKPRIIDRSSVQITVANAANIPIPDDGLKLRYKFKPGTQWVYNLSQQVSVSTISQAQMQNNGRAAVMPVGETERIRLLYSVDNAYGDGDGLLRIQPLPEKGKKTAKLRTERDPNSKEFHDYQMHPVYMRVTNRGWEEFGSIPTYFPLSGSPGAETYKLDLFAVIPLPTLPEGPVRQGEGFPSRFQVGDFNLEKKDELTTLIDKIPARGELLGVEWESGHPCAKIQNTLDVGVRDASAAGQMGNDTQARIETIWFALDLGMPIRIESDIVIDSRIQNAPAAGGGRGGAAPASGGGSGGTSQATGDALNLPAGPPKNFNQSLSGSSQPGGRSPGGQPALGGPSTTGGPGGTGRTGGQANRTQLVRVIFKRVMILEK